MVKSSETVRFFMAFFTLIIKAKKVKILRYNSIGDIVRIYSETM